MTTSSPSMTNLFPRRSPCRPLSPWHPIIPAGHLLYLVSKASMVVSTYLPPSNTFLEYHTCTLSSQRTSLPQSHLALHHTPSCALRSTASNAMEMGGMKFNIDITPRQQTVNAMMVVFGLFWIGDVSTALMQVTVRLPDMRSLVVCVIC